MAVDEEMKVAESIAESTFAEQKLKMKYEAKMLEMEQAKAKVLNKFNGNKHLGQRKIQKKEMPKYQIKRLMTVVNQNKTEERAKQCSNWEEFTARKKHHFNDFFQEMKTGQK